VWSSQHIYWTTVFIKQRRTYRLKMNVSSIKSTNTSTPTLYKLNNWKSTVILWTLNKRKIFPTVTHDGCQYVQALAEWFTCFQLWNHCFCPRPNHQRWSQIFFWKRDKWNILVAHTVHYECCPITHSRKWKGNQLCCWSVKAVNFQPWLSCWTSKYVPQS
jgi:hypothetical protein